MAKVKIDQFRGIAPQLHPTLLQDGMAVKAHNCRMKNGKLVPLREPSYVDSADHSTYLEDGLDDVRRARSMYCWKHTVKGGDVRTDFLAFPGRVRFAHGNIADDEHDRIFVAGDTGVSFTSSNGDVTQNCPAAYLFDRETGEIDRHCICKEALSAPYCAYVEEVNEDTDVSYAYFFVTWFDKYGYESPASLPSRNKNYGSSAYLSEPLRYNANGIVRFSPVHLPEGAVGMRIYKSVAGDETDNTQLIREYGQNELIDVSREFAFAIDDTKASEAMPEVESPPFDMTDIAFVPGNFYAALAKSMPHTVLFSEVDVPTSWPTAYRYDVRDNVVALAVTSNSVFALTDGTPYVISGTAPESMTVASLATAAACVSERGVCVYENAVYFASHRGLFRIANGASESTLCQNITEGLFSKDQWLALNPKSCMIGAHDGALHLFFKPPDGEEAFDDGARGKALTIDMTGGSNAAITTHDEVAECICVDDRSDDTYFVRTNETEEV